LDKITAAGVGLAGSRTAGVLPMSFLLTCPNCGVREVTDFGYGGEISARPTERPTLRELGRYNYFRRNPAGVQREWWFHRSGCRAWFIAERDTTTNEVFLTELPRDPSGGDTT
jgi:heterotetrameric sarcosine oxidase delta subunit